MGKQVEWVGNQVTKVSVEDDDVARKKNYFTSMFGKNLFETS